MYCFPSFGMLLHLKPDKYANPKAQCDGNNTLSHCSVSNHSGPNLTLATPGCGVGRKVKSAEEGEGMKHKGRDCWNSHSVVSMASCYLFCSKRRLSGGFDWLLRLDISPVITTVVYVSVCLSKWLWLKTRWCVQISVCIDFISALV